MPSPVRRSARAAPPASLSSSTSVSSGRQDRVPHLQKQKSVTPHSLSSEDMSEPPRRSKRAHLPTELDPNKQLADQEEEVVDEEEEEDEEITRCICAQQEYPGPPLSEAFSAIESKSDDAGGLFIQCDGCSVWQHGGCVGIVDERHSPEKYFCEVCRPKQHEVHTDVRGQRYSLYLPVTSRLLRRKSSVSKGSDERVKRDRADTVSRASADPTTGKRRGTIRSREHDEEAEQIQRAIEESAREAQGNAGARRNGKRSREESSDDLKQDLKRQRRASESVSQVGRTASHGYDTDDDNEDAGSNHVKKLRTDVSDTARRTEQRDRERERDRVRAEAAGRRQERAGRRRGDDLDLKDTNNPTRSDSRSPPPSSRANSPASFAAPDKPAYKRIPGKKVKKLGNNQYTKNRMDNGGGAAAAASSPHGRKRLLQSGGTSSGDEQALGSDGLGPSGTPSAQDGVASNGVGRGRWGKSKRGGHNANGVRNVTSEPMERTIPNMARNLEGMIAFIQRAQLDVAEDQARVVAAGQASTTTGSMLSHEVLVDQKSAMDLADQLTQGIREWQEKFASPAEAVARMIL